MKVYIAWIGNYDEELHGVYSSRDLALSEAKKEVEGSLLTLIGNCMKDTNCHWMIPGFVKDGPEHFRVEEHDLISLPTSPDPTP